MPYSLDTLAALATILGVVISILALVQSRAWLVLTSFVFVGLAIAGGLYARRERHAREAGLMEIEGYSIDSLNAANLRRRLDRGLVVQEAKHTASIEGENLAIAWEYSGYCRVDGTAAFDFSIDTAAGTSFDELDCRGWDLGHDPEGLQDIRPLRRPWARTSRM